MASVGNYYGTDGDDNAYGSNDFDYMYGYGGDDSLHGGIGTDTLWGGAGNDYLNGDTGTDALYGGDGDDELYAGDYTALNGGAYRNYLYGDAGNDSLHGGVGSDEMHGGTGNDYLYGNDGGDAMYGDAGNDYLWGGVGSDEMHGGTDNDYLYGNDGGGYLYGDAGNDYLSGGVGDDILDGGDGIDTVDYSSATSRVSVILNIPTGQFNQGAGSDTLIGIENLIGTGFDDALTGNTGNNTLSGLCGNDMLAGSDGDDSLRGGNGNDTLLGGMGIDSADYSTATSGVTVSLNVTTIQVTGGAGSDTLFGIENLIGSYNNDILTGNSGNNTLSGNVGNDKLDGGAGIDFMIGGHGNDTYYVDNTGDVTTETCTLVTEIDSVVATVSRTLGANIEKLTLTGTAVINGTGNALANTLIGNAAANILNGGAGNDLMTGGLGNDTYYVDNASDITTETSALVTEIDTVVSSVSRTLGANLERLYLIGTAAINGTGNALANTLIGNAAANILNGGLGHDALVGGQGNDIYYVDNTGDATTETSILATEIDTVVSSVSRLLGTNLERLYLSGAAAINATGNALANTLLGNAGNNTLNGVSGNDGINGGAGNDVLFGGVGNDSLVGGAGSDTFVFDTALHSALNRDNITDFNAVADTIRLDKTIFAKLTTGALNTQFFKASTNGLAGDNTDYVLYNTTSGALLYDADANGAGVAVQFATLSTKPALSFADFMVVA